jgi:succinate dehydrogenase hydrophobic anchor subunit
MSGTSTRMRWEAWFLSRLGRLPILDTCIRSRGWEYLIAWGHRLTGLGMVFFIWLHLFTLSTLNHPEQYNSLVNWHGFPGLIFIEYALAIPIIFHALNGGRLILYESYGLRKEPGMIRWMAGLSMLYLLLLGLFMVMGDQKVDPILFWALSLAGGLSAGYGLILKVWPTCHSLFWKLQRTTGAFLLVMIPAHFLYMHLSPAVAHQAVGVISRLHYGFIRIVDILMLLAVLYHGAYGLVSTTNDYLQAGILRNGLGILYFGLMAVGAVWGVRIIFLLS